MNRTPLERRAQIIHCLVEGNSIAFSKKVENLRAAVSLHFAYYNFVRIHKSLRVTPAMEAGIANEVWSIRDLVELADSN